jgi:hypothetical protein
MSGKFHHTSLTILFISVLYLNSQYIGRFIFQYKKYCVGRSYISLIQEVVVFFFDILEKSQEKNFT